MVIHPASEHRPTAAPTSTSLKTRNASVCEAITREDPSAAVRLIYTTVRRTLKTTT